MNDLTTSDVISLVRKSFAHRTDLPATTLTGRVRLPNPDPPEYETHDSVENITPLDAMTLIAAAWEKYQNGRNFYPTKLDKIICYASLMSEGRWEYLPGSDPICITDGLVTGGRHRLHAILLSNTIQRCNVRRSTTKEKL